jgi:thioredoxin-related protein
MQSLMRRLPIWIALLAAGLLLAPAADAYELVMFRRAGCPWCTAWDRDIGPIYAKSEVGRRTPLRHVDLDRDAGVKLKLKSPVRFTPTFVLVDGDREIGRIEGYPGEDFFWGLLERLTPGPQAEPGSEPVR